MNRPKIVPTKPKHTAPTRGTTTERGYGHAHQKRRKQVLAARPICELCNDAFATDMHHLNHNAHDRRSENLQALCEGCHHRVAHGG